MRSVREVRSQTEYKWFFCSWSRCGLKNVTLRDIPSFPFISCPFVNKCRWVWSYCPMLYKRCTWKKVHLYKRFYLFVHEQEHADQLWTRVKNPERMKILRMWVHMFFMKSFSSMTRSDESRRFPLLSEAEPQAPGSKPLLSVFLNVFYPQTHTTLHRSHEVKQVIKLCTCQTSLFDK